MCRVIVFAGTTEGRKLSAFLEERQIPAMICVATEYGESVLEEYAQLEVHRGRLDQEDMRKLFEEKRPEVVIDATHPYAVEVTKNIRTACEKGGRTYIRVVRKSEEYKKYGKNIYVDSAAEAARYLRSLEHLPRFLTMKSGFTCEFCRLRRLSVYVPSLESVENM